MSYHSFFILERYNGNIMEPITKGKLKAVTISGIVLTALSMIIAIAIAFIMSTIIQWKGNESFYELMAVSILAFGIYYISFAVLSKIFSSRLTIVEK